MSVVDSNLLGEEVDSNVPNKGLSDRLIWHCRCTVITATSNAEFLPYYNPAVRTKNREVVV